eukprot:TRINITY_DN21167_c0_g1_i1.p1 TRINITY_DN21167_c0_g1~~TRINITY_DN21167_c0_g1_i1.p1  ORF type:complete len:551 (-),score=81.80 TRINITY_DN21167_c0_g1_i1:44-1639(-)
MASSPVGTPEHWSDVGAVRARVSLVEQQMQLLQRQISEMCAQMAQTSSGMQKLEMQLAMQRQQHQEDIVKIMATQAMTLSNMSTGGTTMQRAPLVIPCAPAAQAPVAGTDKRSKARPGPRERQKLRQAEQEQQREPTQQSRGRQIHGEAAMECQVRKTTNDINGSQGCRHSTAVETCEGGYDCDDKMTRVAEVLQDEKACDESQEFCDGSFISAEELIDATGDNCKMSEHKVHRKWVLIAFSVFFLYACVLNMFRDVMASLAGLSHIDFSSERLNEDKSSALDSDVLALRDVGHLRLATSDCNAAERWFTKALDALNGYQESNRSSNMDIERKEVMSDLGFAQICSFHHAEGVHTLDQVIPRNLLVNESPHLANAYGYAFLKLNEYERARDIFEVLVKSYPENPLIWNNLGVASTLCGQLAVAADSFYYAFGKVDGLMPHNQPYYRQVISNNIHILRQQSEGSADMWPSAEIFNCMASRTSTFVRAAKEGEFKKRFEALRPPQDEEPLDVDSLLGARTSLLGIEREYVLRP